MSRRASPLDALSPLGSLAALFSRVEALIEGQAWRQASDLLSVALRRAPPPRERAQVRLARAQVASQLGDWAQAELDARKALELGVLNSDERVAGIVVLARCLRARERADEAKALLSELVNGGESARAEVWVESAHALCELGEHDATLGAIQRAFALDAGRSVELSDILAKLPASTAGTGSALWFSKPRATCTCQPAAASTALDPCWGDLERVRAFA